MHSFFLVLALLSSLPMVSACSRPLFQTTTPEVQQLLIGVTGRYLELLAAGDEKLVSEMIFWPDFLDGANFTRADFHKQFEAVRGKWALQNHPLLGLKVLSATSHGNYGEVELQKDPRKLEPGQDPGPKITVELLWSGRGWIVRRDSLFGPDKFFSKFSS